MYKVFAGEYTIILTENILAEYERVLLSPKFNFQKEDVDFILT